uniref:adhesion G protein-coupled receptor A2-like isoform X2 n=1 Tax=Myxine glutinosa TaxID=7769 RepID=UPI00358F3852
MYVLVWLCLSAALSVISSVDAALSACPASRCVCGSDRTGLRVSCSDKALDSVPNPADIPTDTVTLLLYSNHISHLTNNSFHRFSRLILLDLHLNDIGTIEPGAFLGLNELRTLDLSSNLIGCLTRNTFLGLPALQKLNISHNIFSSLQPGVFDKLTALQVLDVGSGRLVCDCSLRWLLSWARSRSLLLAPNSRCSFPRALRSTRLHLLQPAQLACDGPPDLPVFQLLPRLPQLVFEGDPLPLACAASLLPSAPPRLIWLHNGQYVAGGDVGAQGMRNDFRSESKEDTKGLSEVTTVHDCSIVTSKVVLEAVKMGQAGRWECLALSPRGNLSLSVVVSVLGEGVPGCLPQQQRNSRGDFRWPRTLTGTTASLPCPWPRSEHRDEREKFAWRKCGQAGVWFAADYSACQHAAEHTRVLYTFSQLATVVLELCSNALWVPTQVLHEAENLAGACSRLARCVARVSSPMSPSLYSVSPNLLSFSKASTNLAVISLPLHHKTYKGLSCLASLQRDSRRTLGSKTTKSSRNTKSSSWQLGVKCTASNGSLSYLGPPRKISLPQALISFPPSLLSNNTCSSLQCRLVIIVYRDHQLFPTHGAPETSDAVEGFGKAGGIIVSPVIYAELDGTPITSFPDPIALSFRLTSPNGRLSTFRFKLGGVNTMGGGMWRDANCDLALPQGNVTRLTCNHLDYVAVVSVPTAWPGWYRQSRHLHPALLAGSAFLFLCLLLTTLTYVLLHRSIQVARKTWHMVLGVSANSALATGAFAGGIVYTQPPEVCQAVGMILHYSSLSVALWVALMTRGICRGLAPHFPESLSEGDEPKLPRPMLRFYLIGSGIPLIVCGITGAASLENYGQMPDTGYCWMAWEANMGAFLGPLTMILLLTVGYLIGSTVRLASVASLTPSTDLHPGLSGLGTSTSLHLNNLNRPSVKDVGEKAEGKVSSANRTKERLERREESLSQSAVEDWDKEYGPSTWLRASGTHLFGFLACWALGAAAVRRVDVPLEASAWATLFAIAAIMLGGFTLSHNVVRRQDVRRGLSKAFLSCMPFIHPLNKSKPQPQAGVRPLPSPSPSPPAQTKMNNLEVAQGLNKPADSYPINLTENEDAIHKGSSTKHTGSGKHCPSLSPLLSPSLPALSTGQCLKNRARWQPSSMPTEVQAVLAQRTSRGRTSRAAVGSKSGLRACHGRDVGGEDVETLPFRQGLMESCHGNRVVRLRPRPPRRPRHSNSSSEEGGHHRSVIYNSGLVGCSDRRNHDGRRRSDGNRDVRTSLQRNRVTPGTGFNSNCDGPGPTNSFHGNHDANRDDDIHAEGDANGNGCQSSLRPITEFRRSRWSHGVNLASGGVAGGDGGEGIISGGEHEGVTEHGAGVRAPGVKQRGLWWNETSV